MEVISKKTKFQLDRPTAVSVGKFDGMHLGHQLLLRRLLEKKKEGLAAAVFTFDFGERESLMLAKERRRMLDGKLDYLWECPFIPQVKETEAEDFVREFLVKQLHARYLAVGADFHFGYEHRGDCQLLKQMGEELGFQVEIVEKARYQGRDISSTFIREELEKGNMELVNQLLGYAYSVTGEVRHGRKIGRTLGMPTTNLIPEKAKLLPPNGVYASRTVIDGEVFEGITNIGYKPTVGGETQKGVETFLFDFNRDIYGKEITVEFYGFERPECRFASLEELKGRIEQDVIWGKEYFSHL